MCLAAAAALGPILSAVGSIVGAMVSAAGAQQQAEAQARAAEYQAAVARNNATAEAYKGAERAQDVAIQGEYKLAQQRAAFSVGGVDVGTGTPVTVFGMSAARIAGDETAEQYGGRINAQRWQDEAQLKLIEAQNARESGRIAATGAIISGALGGASAFAKGAQALG